MQKPLLLSLLVFQREAVAGGAAPRELILASILLGPIQAARMQRVYEHLCIGVCVHVCVCEHRDAQVCVHARLCEAGLSLPLQP